MIESLKISICVPFRNVSEFVKEAFNSIANQTYKNWELIVFNDGSTHDEKEKLINYMKVFDDNCTLINSENIGLFAARCKMFNEATGDIIVSLDSDDYLYDCEALTKITKEFNNNVDMVIYNNTRSKAGNKNKNFSRIENNIESVRKNFCLGDNLNNIWIKAFKKEIFDASKFDNSIYLNMCEDVYLSTFLLDNTKTVSIIDEPLYYYRENNESIVNAEFNSNRLESQKFVEENLYKYAKKWNIENYNYAKHWFEYMVYGDILYAFKNFEREKRHEIYDMVNAFEYTKKCLKEQNINQLNFPRHKKIPIKMLGKKQYLKLDLYFRLLEKAKKFSR